MKKGLCLSTLYTLLSLLLCVSSFAQVNLTTSPYTENFDNIGSGYPQGWTGRTGANATSLGTVATLTVAKTAWNNTSGAFKNCASADGLNSGSSTTDQNNSTDRALTVRQTGSFGDPGAAFTLQIANTIGVTGIDISFKLQSLDVASSRVTTWRIQYGLGSTPTTFVDIPTNPGSLTTGGSTWTNTTVTATLPAAVENQNQNVWIRIVALSGSTGSGNRATTGVDDFELSFTPPPSTMADRLVLTGAPASIELGQSFSVNICAEDASGNIQTDYNVPISLTQILGNSATITPASPQTPVNGCVTYTITPLAAPDIIDFTATSGTLIADSTGEVTVYNVLSTCYADSSCDFTTYMVQTNTQNDVWGCASSSYSINGFCNGCAQPLTEGWIVSPKFQLNASSNRELNFTLAQTFTGPALEVYYTSGFTGDPTTTSWTALGTVSGSGMKIFDISTLTGTNIQFAFKYVADGTSGGSASYTVSGFLLKSDDCSNTLLSSCTISDLVQWNINGCNNQGTTSTSDDTYSANVTVTFANKPASGLLQLLANNNPVGSVDVTLIPADSITYTFTNIDLPSNNNLFTVEANFSADTLCSYSESFPPRPSCSPAAAIAFNPALNNSYYTGLEFSVEVCFVDENNIPSPQPVYPLLTLDISPALGQVTSGPVGAGPCFTFTVLPVDTGAVTLNVFDANLDFFASDNTRFVEQPCVFISEVVDPTSGNNKFLEVYNGSNFPVDISNYKLLIYANGNTSPNFTLDVAAGTILQPTETYAFRNTSAGQDFSACGTRLTTNNNFNTNGNDAFEWVESGFVHDRYGVVGEDPPANTSWNYADKVVTRNPDIYCGNAEFDLTEWSMATYSGANQGTPCNHCVTPIAAAEPDTLCQGDTLRLTGKGGATYTWTGPNGFSSSIQNPEINSIDTAATGWYVLTITTANTCTDLVDSLWIQVNESVTAVATLTPDTVYTGGSADFSATGGESYSWSGPLGFTSNQQNFTLNNVTPDMAGDYTVTVSNACGSDSATVSLTVLALPVAEVTVSPNPACTGDTVQLDVEPAGLSYAWSGPNGFTSTLKDPVINNVTQVNSGLYTVTVTYPGNQIVEGSAGLEVLPAVMVNIESDPLRDTFCFNSTLTLSTSDGPFDTYEWRGPDNQVISDSSTALIVLDSLSKAGDYVLKVTSNSGCGGMDTFRVNMYEEMAYTLSDSVLCRSDTLIISVAGVMTFTVIDGNGNSANFTNEASFPMEDYTTGQWYIWMYNSATGCYQGDSFNITVLDEIVLTATADPNPACAGSTVQLDVTTTETGTYSWSGPDGFMSMLKNPVITDFQLSKAGDYIVTMTNTEGCMKSDTVNVSILPAPEINATADPDTLCVGGSVQLDVTTTETGTFQWSGPDGFSSTLQNPVIDSITMAGSGDYIVSLTLANGCVATDTVNVVVNPLPELTATAVPDSVCQGGSVQLNVITTDMGTFAWSGPNGFTSTQQNPLLDSVELVDAGAYIVTMTLATGCSATDTVNVVVNTLPLITATAMPATACEGDSVQLGVNTSETGTFLWSGPNGFTSTLQNPLISSIDLTAAGDYIVTMTLASGCSSSDTVSVMVLPAPQVTASADPNPACVGGTVQLNATGSGSFSWSGPNGFTSNIQNPALNNISLADAGAYIVMLTNADGCSSSDTVELEINQMEEVTATATPNPACTGSNVQLNATGTGTFSWTGPNGFSSGLQNPVLTNVTMAHEGNYIVTLTSPDGCISSDTVSLDINLGVPVNVTATPNPVCVGDLLQLSASGTGSFKWTGPLGFNSDSKDPQRRIFEVGMGGIYSVTVVDASGCMSTGSVNVTVLPGVEGSAWTDVIQVCKGDTARLFATGGGTYAWSGPNGFSSSSQNPVIIDWQLANVGIYTVTITNSAGCQASYQVKMDILYPPVASASFELSTACEGADLQLYGKGAGLYSWTGPGGWTSTLQNPVRTNINAAMSGLYILTVTSPNGCQDTAWVHVKIYPSPQLTITQGPIEVCEGEGVQLNAEGGGTITWTGPYGYKSEFEDPYISNIPSYMSGYYVATIVGETGCIGRDSVLVRVFSEANTSASVENPTPCEGGQIRLHASGGNEYLWTGPGGYHSTDPNPVIYNITNNHSGEYQVLIWSGAKCFATHILKVEVKRVAVKPYAFAVPNPVREGGSARLYASPGLSYSWTGPLGFTSNLQNPVIPQVSRSMAGNYYVKIVDSSGCVVTPYFYLRVIFDALKEGGSENVQFVSGTVYPNPASSEIILESESALPVSYFIYSMDGKQVMKGESNDLRIDVSSLLSGSYRIIWNEAGNTEFRQNKFVKIK